jgi:hypothetical protein
MSIDNVEIKILSAIAGFEVDDIINEKHRNEVTFIGVNPLDVLVMSHKDFWAVYRCV